MSAAELARLLDRTGKAISTRRYEALFAPQHPECKLVYETSTYLPPSTKPLGCPASASHLIRLWALTKASNRFSRRFRKKRVSLRHQSLLVARDQHLSSSVDCSSLASLGRSPHFWSPPSPLPVPLPSWAAVHPRQENWRNDPLPPSAQLGDDVIWRLSAAALSSGALIASQLEQRLSALLL